MRSVMSKIKYSSGNTMTNNKYVSGRAWGLFVNKYINQFNSLILLTEDKYGRRQDTSKRNEYSTCGRREGYKVNFIPLDYTGGQYVET